MLTIQDCEEIQKYLEFLHKRESKYYHPSKVSFELHYIRGTEKPGRKFHCLMQKRNDCSNVVAFYIDQFLWSYLIQESRKIHFKHSTIWFRKQNWWESSDCKCLAVCCVSKHVLKNHLIKALCITNPVLVNKCHPCPKPHPHWLHWLVLTPNEWDFQQVWEVNTFPKKDWNEFQSWNYSHRKTCQDTGHMPRELEWDILCCCVATSR